MMDLAPDDRAEGKDAADDFLERAVSELAVSDKRGTEAEKDGTD